MSLLIVNQWEDSVELVADTLVVGGESYEPEMYHQKVFPIPASRMIMAATGTAEVASAWYRFILEHPEVGDIEAFNKLAPGKLREIQAEVENAYGDAETSTIHLYGFPDDSEKVVSYTYTSNRGGTFEPARFEGNRFMFRPGPRAFTPSPAHAPEEIVELAYRIREEHHALRDAGEGWVPIGGELWAFRIDPEGIQVMKWHRFPDFDETLPNYV